MKTVLTRKMTTREDRGIVETKKKIVEIVRRRVGMKEKTNTRKRVRGTRI